MRISQALSPKKLKYSNNKKASKGVSEMGGANTGSTGK
jgi:hypothetical protein